MLYIIVDKSKIEKCETMGMCKCMCQESVMRWNTNETKAIMTIQQECKCCNNHECPIYTKESIDLLIKNDPTWANKNIV